MLRGLFFCFLLINSVQAKGHHPQPGGHHVKAAGVARKPGPVAKPVLPPKKIWLTLQGAEPLVIARGGYSGLFPESSEDAYASAQQLSLPGSVLFCDLQMTKDNLGFCQSEIKLDNSTDIAMIFPKGQKTYNVNGQNVMGWFGMDYTLDELIKSVKLIENLFMRSPFFDGKSSIQTLDNLAMLSNPPPRLWVNVQYEMFYAQHNLNVARYIEESVQYWVADYISSPEIGFLKVMAASKMDKARTKLIFRFLDAEAVEPTTKEKYSAWLGKLPLLKTFVSGILVPKQYVWPVGPDNYLQPATTIVADAHKLGLEVFVSGFANDNIFSQNYSSDPVAEYLQFVDNSQFAVDGFLTDFCVTASEAISCLAQNQNATTKVKNALVISHNGASGVYPGSTDLAYEQAINDGADIIDCAVQMSKDGVAFCLESADLTGKTNAAMVMMDRSTSVPEVQNNTGVFSFDLTWSEIQTLKPQMANPFSAWGLQRNPRNKNAGKFVTLPEFLEFAKTKASRGVLITIENAAYLASKKGLDVVAVVTSALSNATLDKQPTQRVLIQSDDSSVLTKFKGVPSYERVLVVNEPISDAPRPAVDEVKKYADAINLPRKAVLRNDISSVTTKFTRVVEQMHAANLSVYISGFANEYPNIPIDVASDPYIELATYVGTVKVDGVITDHPKTASAYMRTPCANSDNPDLPYVIQPVIPGDFLQVANTNDLPPAAAPQPPLEVSDVVDPPLPAVATVVSPPPSGSAASGSGTSSAPADQSSSSAAGANLNPSINVAAASWMMIALLSYVIRY